MHNLLFLHTYIRRIVRNLFVKARTRYDYMYTFEKFKVHLALFLGIPRSENIKKKHKCVRA